MFWDYSTIEAQIINSANQVQNIFDLTSLDKNNVALNVIKNAFQYTNGIKILQFQNNNKKIYIYSNYMRKVLAKSRISSNDDGPSRALGENFSIL